MNNNHVVDDDFDEKIEIKRRRKRDKPNNRWTNDQTASLLNYVIRTIDNFEKPTAQMYYKYAVTNISILRNFEWNLLRHKIRNLKRQYQKAIEWQKTEGITFSDNRVIKDQILKMCPYWDRLMIIFEKLNRKGRFIINDYKFNILNGSNISYEAMNDIEMDASNENHYRSNVLRRIDIPSNAIETECDFDSSQNGSDDEITKSDTHSHSSHINDTEVNNLTYRDNNMTYVAPDSINAQISLQQNQIELEREKLALKKATLKIRQFEIEKNFELNCKQIESDEKLKILQLERDERITKYELELKYRIQNEMNFSNM